MQLANLNTPSTLFLAIYDNGTQMACTASLRATDGQVVADVTQHTSDSSWASVDAFMADAANVGTRHIIIFTNAAFLVDALTGRVKTPAPDSTESVYQPRKGGGKYEQYPVGGNQHWWNVIRHLLRYWCKGGTWQVVAVGEDKLGKGKELLAQIA
jgi:hypothetical protein